MMSEEGDGSCTELLCSDSGMDVPPEGNGTLLSIDTFPKEALEVMDLMRRQRVLCDVEIRVGSESFPAHRLVLLSMSPYFRAMFAGGLREVALPVVQIQGVCPSTMAAVVRFAYTGRVRIDQHNVCQLLPAATMFQVSHIIEACCGFLEKQLEPSNCIGIGDFALQHGCSQLYLKVNEFIDQNFPAVSEGEEFLSLTAGQLVALVKRDELNVRCESEVFNAVLRWVKHDEGRRRSKMADVLYAVRCHFLTPRFLKQQLQTCDLVRSMPQCCDYLSRIIQDLTVRRQYTVAQRRPQVAQVVYCVGGYQQNSLGALECLCPPHQWFRLADLACPRSGLGAAFLSGKLYAVGGRNNSRDKSYDCASVDCYDPVTNAWSACADMSTPRNRVGAAVLDGHLYAVGGSNGVLAVDGFVYAIGGYDGVSQLKSVERYDTEKDEWEPVAPMRSPRSALAVALLGGKIYALGGYDGSSFLSTVELFDLETEQWVDGATMQAGKSGHAAAVWRAPCLMHAIL
ncbi:gigaxonin, putative [Ixodes scapularis]|uniref:Kelch-like protein diablo n=1 Tax=Ixodes scapularis TaxID=6945 RepID=B7Q0R8_IXOSC|nr:gigaxonin, putative [Ixodes scapularis]|eukprot:XP_002408279.1 gigaxonin, putative [Ixodes scapularis]